MPYPSAPDPSDPPRDAAAPRRRLPSSTITSFIDHGRVDALLRPWLPDDRDRAFVVRCMLDEGPAHHRGATYTLLALLGEAVRRRGAVPALDPRAVPVPMRVAAHHADPAEHVYPLGVPRGALEAIAGPGSPAVDAMLDCLTDGPSHHALANAACVCLISALLAAPDAP
jgi:hypothetical protein